MVKIGSLSGLLVTFCAQKVTKKAWLSKNLTILIPLWRRKKNSLRQGFGPAAPLIREAQTVFCFFRLRDIKMEIFLRPFVKWPDTSLGAWIVLCLAKHLTGISMLTSYYFFIKAMRSLSNPGRFSRRKKSSISVRSFEPDNLKKAR